MKSITMHGLDEDVEKLIKKIKFLLPKAMLCDQDFVRRKLQGLIEKRKRIKGQEFSPSLYSLEKRLEESVRERENRQRRIPALPYPPELPIMAKRDEIVHAIKTRQVIIVSGETGCGKSTQIPKMCLEAGRGIAGKIGCTEPRRIAAITIAHRIAEELGETIGHSVGYKIRFQDRTPRQAFIKIMTDGMLLAETQSDPDLYEYDTLIIDEAHERSLNIDFLLGISRRLLSQRPELKLIITSATLDTEKFSQAFDGAPVIEVSGRLYPVEVEYRPAECFFEKTKDIDYIDMTIRAVELLKKKRDPGDILIFMPTEQDILEICQRLEGKKYPGTSILPLYARLPASEQGRVYSVGGQKIVVATNVAETSLTIPGIRYVIDTGLARISQYQPGTGINSLPISPISRSSADQRKGRCGRVQEGLCIRLYAEEDYHSRTQFTLPEILRSNLAEVILRMMHLRLGNPAEFPFVDKPHSKNIKDGYEILLELGAITGISPYYELTTLGRKMARMPLDPRLSRMLLEAQKQGCLREVAIITSVLSIRDPRERPPEEASQADRAQAVFRHPDSDFLTLLNLWHRYWGEKERPLSRSQQRKFCEDHYLSFTRMREWAFVYDQIFSILEEMKIPLEVKGKREITPTLYAAIHKAILSGFLSHIAVHKEKNFYLAAKGREVMLWPGSALFQKSCAWVVAAELVQTGRLYARTVAKIDPSWVEELGGHLCRYSHFDPYWDKRKGEVRSKERVTLFGLEIVSDRDISYGPINPEEAHKIFVREALVKGRVKELPPFLRHNLELAKGLTTWEEKLRRRDIVVDEKTMADFYSRRLRGVYDLHGLEKRIQKLGNDDFLRMGEQDLLLFFPDEKELAGFPDVLEIEGRSLEVSYKFAPGEEDDGATVKVAFPLVKSLPAEILDWGLPGHFQKKIEALMRGLPKNFRKQLMPVSEKAKTIAREIKPLEASFFKCLSRLVKERFQVEIPAAEWAKAEIPDYLKLRVAGIDHEGREVASSRNLDLLKKLFPSAALTDESPAWKNAKEKWEKSGLSSWDFGHLPESVEIGTFAKGYLGLESGENGVNLRLFKSREEALISHKKGVAQLFSLCFGKDIEFMKRYLVIPEEYEKAACHFGGKKAVEAEIVENLKREVLEKNIRSREEFEARASSVVRSLFEKSHLIWKSVLEILDSWTKIRASLNEIDKSIRKDRPASSLWTVIRHEFEQLVPRNFLQIYSAQRLAELPRYLKALEIRIERAKNSPEKEMSKRAQVEPFEQALSLLEKESCPANSEEKKAALEELRLMLEEFKISLFAPEVKTSFPVSAKRLAKKLREIKELD